MSIKNIVILGVTAILTSCTMSRKGDLAAEEYCECSKKDKLDRAKCKKEVLSKYKEELKNEDFLKAFHNNNKCD